MAVVPVTSVYGNGYIVEYAPVDQYGNFTDAYCRSWILLPAENLWSAATRIALYVIAIAYLFIGVAIGSDVFMTSIEVITSRKRTIVMWDEEKEENVKKEVLVWNETVANLTLLALGSSAPEILLATVEVINEIVTGNVQRNGGLGFYTIVGSASFNLLVITGICIVSVPSPDYKKIRDLGVFALTALWSLLAYVWLLACLLWISPNVVEPWEAWLTLFFFPTLVLSAYAQDNRWWISKCRPERAVGDQPVEMEDQATINGYVTRRGSVGIRSAISLSPEKRRKQANNGDVLRTVASAEEASNPERGGSPIRLHRNIRKVSIAPTSIELVKRKSDLNQNSYSVSSPAVAEPIYRPFARARFRHAAIRALGGIRRGPVNYTQMEENTSHPPTPTTEPRLLSVVSKLAAARRTNGNAIQDQSSGSISFASPTYAVLESAGTLSLSVLFHRRKKARGQTLVPTISDEGKFDTQTLAGAVTVDYETREGTAKINKDFMYTTGTLVFTENDFAQTISVPVINDDQYYPDTDFYVILKNPGGDACLGDPSVARVTIIDDDKPGDFVLERSQVYADMERGEVHATVLRQNGCDGKVQVHYTTIDGTAVGGSDTETDNVDYISVTGILEFGHHETSKVITIFVNRQKQQTKNFVIVLRNPSQGSHLGEHSAAVANINLQPGGLNGLSRLLLEDNDQSWTGQFKNAMNVGGETDEYGNEIPPGGMDYFLHALSLPWKLFFALAPTRHTYGGFPAFLVSMLMIGALTAVIEQLGHLLGCVSGLKTQVTGITIIALGTSLPDTIASRTAALQDDYADASIGNITGSNSVNVFLGLGLPWVIRTMYYLSRSEEYRVEASSLQFSVILFDSLGLVCVVFLFFRRFLFGGELGGPKLKKYLSGGMLFLLWLVFVFVSSFKAYEYF